MSKEAMKQALEALEAHADIGIKSDKAITSLRKAITEAEKQEQGEPVAWGVIASNTGKMCQVELDYDEVSDINSKWLVPLYTTPPQSKEPEQEPVAWMCHPFGDDECEFSDHQECENCIPLYTTPQQRKPLTDEQIADIVIEMNGNEPPALFWKDLTRAIEAAHGIKE